MSEQALVTGTCDSCGHTDVPLFARKHHQLNNPKIWMYCDMCSFAHDRELEVQKQLSQVAVTEGMEAASDPARVADIAATVETDMIQKRAADEIKARQEEVAQPAETPAE